MNTNERNFRIQNGPSADRLFSACRYAYDKYADVAVNFTVIPDNLDSVSAPIQIDDAKIISISHEDGSGHSFNLEGYCWASLDLYCEGRLPAIRSYQFKAYYNAKDRTGHITFTLQAF